MKRSSKIFIVICLLLSFILGMVPAAAASETTKPITPEMERAAQILSSITVPGGEKGTAPIVTGDGKGNLYLDQSITRAQVATIISKTAPVREYLGPRPIFDDIQNHWARIYINILVSMNIASGYNGKFSPDEDVLVCQMYAFTIRMLGYDTSNLSYPKGIIEKAHELGLDKGITSDPLNTATRAEAFLILFNALHTKIYNQDKTPLELLSFKIVEGVVTKTGDTDPFIPANQICLDDGSWYSDTITSRNLSAYLGCKVRIYYNQWEGTIQYIENLSGNSTILDAGIISTSNGNNITVNGNQYDLTKAKTYINSDLATNFIMPNGRPWIKQGMYARVIKMPGNTTVIIIKTFDDFVYERNVIFAGVSNGRIRYNTFYPYDGVIDLKHRNAIMEAMYPAIYKGNDILMPEDLKPGDIISIQQVERNATVVVIDNENRSGIYNGMSNGKITIGGKSFEASPDITYSWNQNKDISRLSATTLDYMKGKTINYRLDDQGKVRHVFFGDNNVGVEAGIVEAKREAVINGVKVGYLTIYNAYSLESKEYTLDMADGGLSYSEIGINDRISFMSYNSTVSKVSKLKPTLINSPSGFTKESFTAGGKTYTFDRTIPFIREVLTGIPEYVYNPAIKNQTHVPMEYQLMLLNGEYEYKTSMFNTGLTAYENEDGRIMMFVLKQ